MRIKELRTADILARKWYPFESNVMDAEQEQDVTQQVLDLADASVPNAIKGIQACKRCGILKTFDQFYQFDMWKTILQCKTFIQISTRFVDCNIGTTFSSIASLTVLERRRIQIIRFRTDGRFETA